MKPSFVLYTEYANHIEMLSNEEAGILLKDIMKYVRDDIEPKYSDDQGMLKMAFSFIKSQLDRDSDKYEITIEKRRAAGRQGGLANASKRKQTLANASKRKQNVANQAVYVNDNVNVNDNDNVNNNICVKETKHCYGEYKHVRLTDKQYQKLLSELGETKMAAVIKKLDEYIQEKPSYKSNDHNLTIRKWVIKAVEEDDHKSTTNYKKQNITFRNFDMKHDYDYKDMENMLLEDST